MGKGLNRRVYNPAAYELTPESGGPAVELGDGLFAIRLADGHLFGTGGGALLLKVALFRSDMAAKRFLAGRTFLPVFNGCEIVPVSFAQVGPAVWSDRQEES